MKKSLLILVFLSLYTACNIESVDTINELENAGGDGLVLNGYILKTETELPFFGTTTINTTFGFNSNGNASNMAVETVLFGTTATENVTITRNSDNQITGFESKNRSTTTNETSVIYDGDNITQIVYDFAEDDFDDYIYNFAYTESTITRTQLGSNISTVFTLDELGRIMQKESFENGSSILKEEVTYDANGNCISSEITGDFEEATGYSYDTEENPLKSAFSDQYLLTFLNDDYEDGIAGALAQFYSANNWTAITIEGTTVDLTIEYNSSKRITSRSGTYSLISGEVSLGEIFQYLD